jgi:hypothetical protein
VQVSSGNGAEDRKLIGGVVDIEYVQRPIPYGSSTQVGWWNPEPK